ncbi:hypothetical protein IKF21_01170 [Candidatus Saccharibacteria bacterium]|nr:hypothetical protein [Candidatus Saccharibacteria bacterium]
MTKEVEALKKQISDLENELAASMRREELKKIVDSSGGSLKQKVKNKIKSTRLWRAADDPNDKLGKIIRSPRTITRIVTNPSVVKEIKEKNKHVKCGKNKKNDIFMPIKFFFSEDDRKRINVVLVEIDLEMIKMGILLAKEKNMELRIVATKEKVDTVWYRKMIKDNILPKCSDISFYNTTEQNIRAKTFELEVSRGDIFLTKAWVNNG